MLALVEVITELKGHLLPLLLSLFLHERTLINVCSDQVASHVCAAYVLDYLILLSTSLGCNDQRASLQFSNN